MNLNPVAAWPLGGFAGPATRNPQPQVSGSERRNMKFSNLTADLMELDVKMPERSFWSFVSPCASCKKWQSLAGRLSTRPQSAGLPKCSDRRSDTVFAEPLALLALSEERRGSLHPECLCRVLDFERSNPADYGFIRSKTVTEDSHINDTIN
ncbi:hypothetical protein MG293_018797 [Ovis ammon polii]|uniref:Uncharacterized protein n=1 Tax=Ovis ammon polii TaxID=230172 RepID=A0AAD4TRA6_OVIAM|nr:hypothetical protein MG293_018797 [Ovis ammon polii]